jgi:6-phosphofructokinase 1
MVALAPPHVRYEPLADVVRRMKTVAIDSDTVRTARDIGISFGDRVG